MKKKSQAAMEFLMTYGWAFLVLLLVIGTLSYFGVLNTSKFLPESCTLVPGLSCVDFEVTTTGIVLAIHNGMGHDLKDVSITVGDCDLICDNCETSINNDQKTIWKNENCQINSGRFKEEIIIIFKKVNSALTHTKIGELISKVSKKTVSVDEEESCPEETYHYGGYCWLQANVGVDCNQGCESFDLTCSSDNWNDYPPICNVQSAIGGYGGEDGTCSHSIEEGDGAWCQELTNDIFDDFAPLKWGGVCMYRPTNIPANCEGTPPYGSFKRICACNPLNDDADGPPTDTIIPQ